jgi:hypothetical protein
MIHLVKISHFNIEEAKDIQVINYFTFLNVIILSCVSFDRVA